MIDLEKLLRVPAVQPETGFDISPDGRTVVFSWDPTGQWELYALPLDVDEPQRSARCLTAGPGAKFGPHFSPDGKRLAYVLDLDGSEAFDLYVLELETGKATNLTPDTPFALMPGFAWSPEGDRIAVLADRDGMFEVYLMSALSPPSTPSPNAGGRGEPVTSGSPDDVGTGIPVSPDVGRMGRPVANGSPDDVEAGIPLESDSLTSVDDLPPSPGIGSRVGEANPRAGGEGLDGGEGLQKLFTPYGPAWKVQWSKTGKWLAVTCEGQGQDHFTYIVPVDGSPAHRVEIDGRAVSAIEPAWSPDGRQLAFSSDFSGYYDIGLWDPQRHSLEWATAGVQNYSSADWSPDGGRLACVISEGADTWLGVLDCSTGELQRYQVEPGVHYSPAFTPDGRQIVFIFDSPRRTDDLWSLELESGMLRQLTRSMPPDLSPEHFVRPQEIQYPSYDGSPVPALLFVPPGHDPEHPGPALILIHGGPNWLFQFLWYPAMAHPASRGWVVLAPNYRGSVGYGRAWQEANRFEMGRLDTDDCAAGVDYLVEHRLADPKRIAVSGRSHGGYLTMSCLTRYPEKFAVGSAVVPFINWFTSHAASRRDLQHWDRENMGDPVENADLWRERSPFFFLDRIQAPVQLISGANDPRCPASESIAARDQLQRLGKVCELLLYPDEGHGFLRIDNVVDHELKRMAFLAQRLEE